MKVQLLFILILLTSFSYRQCEKKQCKCDKKEDNLLGQKLPGDTAVIFAWGTVSSPYHEHSRLVQTMDGQEIFWAVVITNEEDKNEEQKIWYIKKKNCEWTKPVRIPVPSAETRSPSLSPDGQKLYFLTNVPDSDSNEMPPKSILWEKRIDDTAWTNIKRIDGVFPELENQMIMSYSFASNGNLYFDLGGPDDTGKWSWRIYFSRYKEGLYEEPQLMGNRINEGRICQYPFVAPDESYLIFSSDREGSFGWGDLYISYSNDKGGWSIPMNMGNTVNTPSQERSPSVSPDGRFLFFTRHNQNTFQDFYWVDAKIISKLRPDR